MRIDFQFGLTVTLASVPLAVAIMAAPFYFHVESHAASFFWGGIVLFLIILLFAVVIAIRDEEAAKKRGQARPVLAIFGMVIFGMAFIGCAAWYFLPSKAQSDDSSLSAVARLSELGWTVKPGAQSTMFEVWNMPLPPMKESAIYFRQFGKPFNLHFQQAKNLDGLHYLADVPGCTTIEINAGEFSDISELKGFTHLTKLVVSQLPLNSYDTVDPSALASLINLETLVLNSSKIRTTDFLSNLKRLKTLNLGQTLITDISAAASLPELEDVDVRGTRVTDLSPLAHDEKLTKLHIGGQQIGGLPALAHLPNLKSISIIEQQPFDLAPVAALTNLESLWVWGPFTGSLDAAPLQKMTKLRDLTLGAGGFNNLVMIRNVNVIGDLVELRSLTLGQLTVTDLSFVSKLTHLNQLILNQLPVTSYEPLRNLKMLKTISVNGVGVSDISPFLALPALTELTMGHTPARTDVLEELRRRGVTVKTY